ncbi:MAG TPA: diacylglyceryl transferase [Candidatus Korarchaeota archaeon]|nr:diacylglyceryl transferase [Candidatus Korarchaeota archaeon]
MISKRVALEKILNEFISGLPEVSGVAILTRDGLPVASKFRAEAPEEEVVGAMSASMLAIGERVAMEFGHGGVQKVLVIGDTGYAMLMGAGPDVMVVAILPKDAKIGLAMLELRRASEKIARIVSEYAFETL